MTQTLQDALLKAGLISQEKLKKAEIDKKAAQRAARRPDQPSHMHGPQGQGRRPDAKPHFTKPVDTKPVFTKPVDTKPHFTKPVAPKPPVRQPRPEEIKGPGFIEGKHHHHSRTDCEACGHSSPDVEYYEHKNRSLNKYWLCVKCADTHNIHDDFRQTMQSPQAMRGLFQRNYGPTKIFRKKM